MRLFVCLGVFDSVLQDLLCFLDELSMQVYRIVWDSSWRIVFSKDIFGRLFVVLICLFAVLLAFLGELMRGCAIAAVVCFCSLFNYLGPIEYFMGVTRELDGLDVLCVKETVSLRSLVVQDHEDDHILLLRRCWRNG